MNESNDSAANSCRARTGMAMTDTDATNWMNVGVFPVHTHRKVIVVCAAKLAALQCSFTQ